MFFITQCGLTTTSISVLILRELESLIELNIKQATILAKSVLSKLIV